MKIGYCITGSFCTHAASLSLLKRLSEKYDIYPVISEICAASDTRFGKAKELLNKVREITKKEPMLTSVETEALGPSVILDLLFICPCTGNTLAKIAAGITDTAVTMAAKATLRRDGNVLIALNSNDALGENLKNIGHLLNRKCVYFVPMYQDDPIKKPHSLMTDMSLAEAAVEHALLSRQMYPLIKG